MVAEQLSRLYKNYIQAFATQDLQAVKQCYLMPCTLSTPDNVMLLKSDEAFHDAFSEIFTQLSSAQVTAFKTSDASFEVVSEQLVLACVNWQFLTDANNIFAEFTAIYHLTKCGDDFKVINVISQDVSQSLNLEHPLVIDMENK